MEISTAAKSGCNEFEMSLSTRSLKCVIPTQITAVVADPRVQRGKQEKYQVVFSS